VFELLNIRQDVTHSFWKVSFVLSIPSALVPLIFQDSPELIVKVHIQAQPPP